MTEYAHQPSAVTTANRARLRAARSHRLVEAAPSTREARMRL
jgi:hypothetical protein